MLRYQMPNTRRIAQVFAGARRVKVERINLKKTNQTDFSTMKLIDVELEDKRPFSLMQNFLDACRLFSPTPVPLNWTFETLYTCHPAIAT